MEDSKFQYQRPRKITTTSLSENAKMAIKTRDASKAYRTRRTVRLLHPQPKDSEGSNTRGNTCKPECCNSRRTGQSQRPKPQRGTLWLKSFPGCVRPSAAHGPLRGARSRLTGATASVRPAAPGIYRALGPGLPPILGKEYLRLSQKHTRPGPLPK